jgi:trigger factor
MQITETVSEGLHREFLVKVGASDLDAKLVGRLAEMAPKIHLKGFRPGKAPVAFLKKTYGKSIMTEIVEQTVNETYERALKEREIKPAMTPRVDLVNPIENVVEGTADLEFTLKVDLMPDFAVADLGSLKAERLVAEVDDDEIGEAVQRLAQSQRTYQDKGEGAKAEDGDVVTIDFVGKLDGEPFEGGKAESFDLLLGSGAFVPGFEEQLQGAKAGDERTLDVTFPEGYGAANLAGKAATFDVTVKAVKRPEDVAIDDELAKKLGLESLPVLRDRVRDQLRSEHVRASRLHLKRRLLDALDEAHRFAVPPTMVEVEFGGIWRQVQQELARENKTPADEGKTEDELKAEYQAIAERRVRLGLVLARIGEQNGITVSNDELNRAIAARARQFPGQERQVAEYYAKTPQAQAELRAPIFEDKVIDFLAELITVSERKVDRQTLFLDPDEAAAKLEAEAPAKGKAKKADTEKAEKPAKSEKAEKAKPKKK